MATAGEVAGIVNDAIAKIDMATQLYLVDLAQRQLHPVPQTGLSLEVDSSVAGRAFRLVEIIAVKAEGR